MGAFDAVFQALAEDLVDLFVDTPATVTRVRDSYNEDSGKTVPIVEKTLDVKIAPPQPYEIKKVNGTTILAQDMFTYAPAKPFLDAGFDALPTTGVSIMVATRSRTYKVERVEIISSGDEEALYGFQLRP